jgi:ribosomal protein S12 methylthiotransferase
MHRLGTKTFITEIVNRFRRRVPGVTFRTGFIVGFPGETKAAFRELKRYLTEMEFDRVGVFGYSDEEGTAAAALPGKISRDVMEERRDELLILQEGISLRKNRNRIGTVIEVLVDGPSEETDLLLEGRHQGQAPDIDGVVYLNEGNASPGDFVKAEIIDAHAYDLVGRIAG